ncbi:hypothetical protein I41_16660 [Lacipirellula limnantheis]|uniref:Uncharacterized protein n=1 Tax=Lacipirellula limnantheis TaxID=2528024 RepID=A0A517TVU7_9BACT|nr:hypothetical protein I41_16660 [Lacipirellula limnantheis]
MVLNIASRQPPNFLRLLTPLRGPRKSSDFFVENGHSIQYGTHVHISVFDNQPQVSPPAIDQESMTDTGSLRASFNRHPIVPCCPNHVCRHGQRGQHAFRNDKCRERATRNLRQRSHLRFVSRKTRFATISDSTQKRRANRHSRQVNPLAQSARLTVSTRRSHTFVCVGPVRSSPPTASKKV